jgi:hypothetical protein
VSVSVGAATWTDLASNYNVGSPTYALQVVPGSVFNENINQAISGGGGGGGGGGGMPCGSSTNANPLVFHFDFPETTKTFDLTDIGQTGCVDPKFGIGETVGATSGSGLDGSASYTLSCQASTTGVHLPVTVWVDANKFSDLAGNLNEAIPPCTLTSDDLPPVVVVSSMDGVNNGETTHHRDPDRMTFGFIIEDCSDFSENSVHLDDCTDAEFSLDEEMSDPENLSYQFFVECTPTADTIQIDVIAGSFSDCAGNKNVEPGINTPFIMHFHDHPPSVTITGSAGPAPAPGHTWPPLPKVGECIPVSAAGISGVGQGANLVTFTFTLDAASTDFALEDVAAENCESPVFMEQGNSTTGAPANTAFVLTCKVAADVSATVPERVFTNEFGELNLPSHSGGGGGGGGDGGGGGGAGAGGAGSISVCLDSDPPGVTITSADGTDGEYWQGEKANVEEVAVHYEIRSTEPTGDLLKEDLTWQVNRPDGAIGVECASATLTAVSDSEYVATCNGRDGETITLEVPPSPQHSPPSPVHPLQSAWPTCRQAHDGGPRCCTACS